MTIQDNSHYMTKAIELAVAGVAAGGGPFGAVIVAPDGRVVGSGHNRVTIDHDPTAHGEITAIRDACRRLGDTNLKGYTLFTSAEPCPGCFTEIVFNAGIRTVYFAATIADATDVGFADAPNWIALGVTSAEVASRLQMTYEYQEHPDHLAPFQAWAVKTDRTDYYPV